MSSFGDMCNLSPTEKTNALRGRTLQLMNGVPSAVQRSFRPAVAANQSLSCCLFQTNHRLQRSLLRPLLQPLLQEAVGCTCLQAPHHLDSTATPRMPGRRASRLCTHACKRHLSRQLRSLRKRRRQASVAPPASNHLRCRLPQKCLPPLRQADSLAAAESTSSAWVCH